MTPPIPREETTKAANEQQHAKLLISVFEVILLDNFPDSRRRTPLLALLELPLNNN